MAADVITAAATAVATAATVAAAAAALLPSLLWCVVGRHTCVSELPADISPPPLLPHNATGGITGMIQLDSTPPGERMELRALVTFTSSKGK